MILSRIQLDVNRRDTMLALSRPSMIHGAIEMAASDNRQRKLWRIDTLNDRTYLLILSESPLNLGLLREQFGFAADESSSKSTSYDQLLHRLTAGSRWHFRLVANPSVCRARGQMQGKSTRVHNHVTPEQHLLWLGSRAASRGFELREGEYSVTEKRWQKFQKRDNNRISQLAVAFEGELTITDVELFKHALTNGIGHGKAYGLGLLTIARC